MIDQEDLVRGFEFVPTDANCVRLGAGVLVAPHTDPFLHPLIYDFIKMASERFPTKTITTVTTGAYIDIDKLDILCSIPNYGIDLSLITMQQQREFIIPRSERAKTMYLLEHAPLNKCTIMFTGDMDEMKKDLELLYKLDVHKRANQILVRRIEHTDSSLPVLKELPKKCINQYEECITWINENYPGVVYTVPELKSVYRGGNNEYFASADERIMVQKKFISNVPKDLTVNIISPLSGFEYFKSAFRDAPNVSVNLIRNRLYGGSVSVAGLLNHADIKSQFNPQNNDVMILPREMYNSDDVDIQGEPRKELERWYNAKVIVI